MDDLDAIRPASSSDTSEPNTAPVQETGTVPETGPGITEPSRQELRRRSLRQSGHSKAEKRLNNKIWYFCMILSANYFPRFWAMLVHIFGMCIAVSMISNHIRWAEVTLLAPTVLTVVNILWCLMCMGVVDGLTLAYVEIISSLAEAVNIIVLLLTVEIEGLLKAFVIIYLFATLLKLFVDSVDITGWHQMHKVELEITSQDTETQTFVNRIVRSSGPYEVVRNLHRNFKISEQIFARYLVHPLKRKSTSRLVRQHSYEMVRWAPSLLVAFNRIYMQNIIDEAREIAAAQKYSEITSAPLNDDDGLETQMGIQHPPEDEAMAQDLQMAQQLHRELNETSSQGNEAGPSCIFEPSPTPPIPPEEERSGFLTEEVSSENPRGENQFELLEIRAEVHARPNAELTESSVDDIDPESGPPPNSDSTQAMSGNVVGPPPNSEDIQSRNYTMLECEVRHRSSSKSSSSSSSESKRSPVESRTEVEAKYSKRVSPKEKLLKPSSVKSATESIVGSDRSLKPSAHSGSDKKFNFTDASLKLAPSKEKFDFSSKNLKFEKPSTSDLSMREGSRHRSNSKSKPSDSAQLKDKLGSTKSLESAQLKDRSDSTKFLETVEQRTVAGSISKSLETLQSKSVSVSKPSHPTAHRDGSGSMKSLKSVQPRKKSSSISKSMETIQPRDRSGSVSKSLETVQSKERSGSVSKSRETIQPKDKYGSVSKSLEAIQPRDRSGSVSKSLETIQPKDRSGSVSKSLETIQPRDRSGSVSKSMETIQPKDRSGSVSKSMETIQPKDRSGSIKSLGSVQPKDSSYSAKSLENIRSTNTLGSLSKPSEAVPREKICSHDQTVLSKPEKFPFSIELETRKRTTSHSGMSPKQPSTKRMCTLVSKDAEESSFKKISTSKLTSKDSPPSVTEELKVEPISKLESNFPDQSQSPQESSDSITLSSSSEVKKSSANLEEGNTTKKNRSRTSSPDLQETATDSVSTSSENIRLDSPISRESEQKPDSVTSSPKEQTVDAS